MRKILTLCGVGLATAAVAAPKQTQPNIIFIVADDAGYADFSYLGSQTVKTPNIDKMVENGVRFTNMHVSASVSGPSRCGVMTGRYQQRFGNSTNASASVGLDVDQTTLGDMMQANGYKTAAFGKWHLGSDEQFIPNNRGFDEFWGFLGGARSYFYTEENSKNVGPEIMHNATKDSFDGYLTDVLGQKAEDFIEANKKNPFFIYLSYNAVHTPMEALEEDLALFPEDDYQQLAAMTWALDRSIGGVVAKLQKSKLLDNTLVVFISDNGGDTPNMKLNRPLKSMKGFEFEGGQRVQSWMHLPGVIEAGSVFQGASSSLDFYSTFRALAGGKDAEGAQPSDGVDLMPYVTGDDMQVNPHEWLFWKMEDASGVLYKGIYKWVYSKPNGDIMYNLRDDISEHTDVRFEEAAILAKIRTKYAEWESEMVAPLAPSGYNEVKGYMYEDFMNGKPLRIISPSDYKALIEASAEDDE